MPEPKDKSLEELQKLKLQSEIDKNRAEESLVREQVNLKWYSGKSLKLLATGALSVFALLAALNNFFWEDIREHKSRLVQLKAEVAQAAFDSLNAEKKKIITTIDSLKNRATISAVFGNLDSLLYANILTQYKMIVSNNYYDVRLNPAGKGVENEFETQIVEDDTVIYDAATKLTWQGGCKFSRMDWVNANAYVDTLSYAGHSDWRLPTLEEAMSLIEPKTNEVMGADGFNKLHVDARFTDTPDIWAADVYDASVVWSVFFLTGRCEHSHVNFNDFVRAVR